MKPTQHHHRDFLAQREATHAFTFKPNNPGRPRALAPSRIRPDTGEVLAIASSPATARYLMAPIVNTDRLAALFVRAMTYLNRELLGSHYHRPAFDDRRLSAVGVCEGLPSEGHLHGFLKVPEDLWAKLALIFPEKRDRVEAPNQRFKRDPWSTICPGGTSVVKLLHDPLGWADYVTKEAAMPDFAAKILFYPAIN